MTWRRRKALTLSIYGTSRGFGFVLFEGAAPFDWGAREVKEKHKNTKTFDAIKKLIERYEPDLIVMDDTSDRESRRSSRIRKLYRLIGHLAASQSIDIERYSKAQVRQCFAHVGARNKHEIARAIAAQVPALAHKMPPLRKMWVGDDYRQGLFDAAAIGLTHFHFALTWPPK